MILTGYTSFPSSQTKTLTEILRFIVSNFVIKLQTLGKQYWSYSEYLGFVCNLKYVLGVLPLHIKMDDMKYISS